MPLGDLGYVSPVPPNLREVSVEDAYGDFFGDLVLRYGEIGDLCLGRDGRLGDPRIFIVGVICVLMLSLGWLRDFTTGDLILKLCFSGTYAAGFIPNL